MSVTTECDVYECDFSPCLAWAKTPRQMGAYPDVPTGWYVLTHRRRVPLQSALSGEEQRAFCSSSCLLKWVAAHDHAERGLR